MTASTFETTSPRQAQLLQSFLTRYRARRGRSDPLPPSLFPEIYAYSHRFREDGRLFAATVDLEVTHLFMELDMDSAVRVWNENFATGAPFAEADPHVDADAFLARFDRLDHLTSFTLRCRAFWDKFIGVLFLLYDDERYEQCLQATSRRKFLKKQAVNWPALSGPLLRCLGRSEIQNFAMGEGFPNLAHSRSSNAVVRAREPSFPDDLLRIVDSIGEIRTAEAHSTGTLRKWILAMLAPVDSKESWLIVHWNATHYFMVALRETLLERVRFP